MASVIHLLRDKKYRGGRRQKIHSETPGKILRSASTQLVVAVCQLAEYRHSEEFETDTDSDSDDVRRSSVSEMSRSATRILILFSLSRTPFSQRCSLDQHTGLPELHTHSRMLLRRVRRRLRIHLPPRLKGFAVLPISDCHPPSY